MTKLLFALFLLLASVGTIEAQQTQRAFSCTIVSTATALAEITGCGAVSGMSYHITSINWSSSIISTTTNFFLLQSGTGTDCASSTTSLYAGFALAFTSNPQEFPVPIRAAPSHALCFVHPGAGTRNVTVTGYLAP